MSEDRECSEKEREFIKHQKKHMDSYYSLPPVRNARKWRWGIHISVVAISVLPIENVPRPVQTGNTVHLLQSQLLSSS
jgi:hypothetical protein